MRAVAAIVTALFLWQAPGTEFVELDVAIVDRDNRPVDGLTANDFEVREDGKPVEIKTFQAMSGEAGEEGRELVLLLDDSSVPTTGTTVIQAMAQAMLLRKNAEDEVTVVRLNNDRDEPFGDLQTALSRIDDYKGGAVPFQNRATAIRSLGVMTSIARTLETLEHRRKLLVCIGGPRVCNVLEPIGSSSELWQPWRTALSALARANIAVFAAMPVPPGWSVGRDNGISGLTGGDVFANTSNFDRFVNDLWAQAGHYYLLGYWPPVSKRDVREIRVKVGRKGTRVRARRFRT